MSKTKKEIANLHKMKLNELQAKFAEVTGETTRSPNKTFLVRRISEALHAADAGEQVAKVPEAATPDAEAETIAQPEPASTDGKLTRLEVPELQARYLEVVGRPTGSTNKPYMIWKIREAQKGRIPPWPAQQRAPRGRHVQGAAPAHGSRGGRQAGRGLALARHQKPDGVLPRSTEPLPQAARGRGNGCAVCGRHRSVSLGTFEEPVIARRHPLT